MALLRIRALASAAAAGADSGIDSGGEHERG